jgi:hypothetical protein
MINQRAGSKKLCLNGFRLTLSADEFEGYVQEMPDNSGVTDLRENHAADWFIHWSDGELYAIPRHKNPDKKVGASRTLKCTDQLGLIRSKIADALPDLFSPRPAIATAHLPSSEAKTRWYPPYAKV